jgi:hypothetical protein
MVLDGDMSLQIILLVNLGLGHIYELALHAFMFSASFTEQFMSRQNKHKSAYSFTKTFQAL